MSNAIRKTAKGLVPKPSKKLTMVRNSVTETQKMEMFLEEYYSNPGDIVDVMKRLYHDQLNDNKKRGDMWFRNKGLSYLSHPDAVLKMEKKRNEIMQEYKITRDRILNPLLKIIDSEKSRACDVINASKLLTDKFCFFNAKEGDEQKKSDLEESAKEKLASFLSDLVRK